MNQFLFMLLNLYFSTFYIFGIAVMYIFLYWTSGEINVTLMVNLFVSYVFNCGVIKAMYNVNKKSI